jgi:release factor glutamine methyltransferase
LNIYEPSDDTYLLIDTLKDFHNLLTLEIGVGNGLITQELAMLNNFVVGIDIDTKAIDVTTQRIKKMHLSHQVDLLLGDNISMFDNKFFDLVVFNPPYLPHDRSTDISTDGGIFGIEKTLYWLNSSMNIIKSDGKIIFLISDLSKPFSFLGQQLDKLSSVKLRILSKTKLFFETLYVIEATRTQTHTYDILDYLKD